MKVGDLVKLEKWCKNKGRMAIVYRTEDWESGGVWIKYLDGLNEGDGYAVKQNLILVSES